jgi:hypothetical protein
MALKCQKAAAQHTFDGGGVCVTFVRDQVQRTARMYSDRARAAKANTGSVFEDAQLRSDMFFCKPIVETLK